MDMFIHYTALPQGLALEDAVEGLNRAMEDGGRVNGGHRLEKGGRIDLELEEENVNPKLAQGAVKAYLQKAGFPSDTVLELGGMTIGLYE